MGLISFIRKIGGFDEDDLEDWDDDKTIVPDEEDDDGSIDDFRHMEEEAEIEKVDVKRLDPRDVVGYTRGQCEIMEEAAAEIKMATAEYDAVKSYFSDIQLIDVAPVEIKTEIEKLAEELTELKVDRRIFKSGENRMTQHEYCAMERLEPDMPDVLIEFRNNEAYYETVKKDMKLLEGEQAALRLDARELKRRQQNVLDMAKVSVIGLCFVIGILFVATAALGEAGIILFSIVLFLSALLAIGLYAMLSTARRNVLITQKKLDKATTLLNKIKIKYVNIASTVEYERAKYNVKNSHELNAQYNLYLEVKSERKRVAMMTEQLSETEVKLETLLRQLDLYDPHIWLAQSKALIDPKEMVEVRHELTTRRQKLRAKIRYNENRIEEAKKNIMWIAVNNPDKKRDVMEILDNYESEI